MQNFDYYSGNAHTHDQPDFVVRDPEYFSRIARHHQTEGVRRKDKATRFLSLVLGLCIVSFTSGLIVGIKFGGGKDKEIVDPTTRKAMNDIGSRMSHMAKAKDENGSGEAATADSETDLSDSTAQKAPESATKSFPKEIYPYVIRIGNKFSAQNSQEIADYLSSKGHTVIISKHEDFYRIYVGPYKEKSSAESALNRINYYTDNKYFHSALVLER